MTELAGKDYFTVEEAATYACISVSHWRAQIQREFPPGKNGLLRTSDRGSFHRAQTAWPKSRWDGRRAKHRAYDAARKQRTPAWADRIFMRALHDIARRVSRCTGIPFHVDHILPMHGKTVSGLNVQSNLRVIVGRPKPHQGQPVIASFADLQALSGLTRPADVRRWLQSNGVAFMVQPSGRPVTTLDAINRAMYGSSKFNKPDFSPPPKRCSPPKVHEKNGRYYYVHRNKWHPLSRVSDGATALYEALQAWTNDRPATYGQLMNLYIARALPELREASRPEYVRIINARLQHSFGHMILNTLESGHVAEYLQLRKAEGAPIGGNREKAVLGSIISWGMRFGWVSSNPCHGVRRNREKPSKIYVEDRTLVETLNRAPEPLQDLLAVAYLTGLRQGDLRIMTKDAITPTGIRLVQSKDGKAREITWTPTLRYFVERALARSAGPFVFVGERGRPYSMDGLQSAMRRLGAGFRFRDLRPKAATDAEHNILGHNAQMLGVYVRRSRIKPVR